MTDSVVALMEENLLAVFNERDPQRRLEVIRCNYAPDVRWADGEETVTGQDRLHEKAQELLDGQLAGLGFSQSGPVYQAGNMGFLAWDVFPPGDQSGTPLVSGFDVALVENGVIAKLFTVVTTAPG